MRAIVCANLYDLLVDKAYPLDLLGTEFILVPFSTRSSGDLVRIFGNHVVTTLDHFVTITLNEIQNNDNNYDNNNNN